MSLSSGQRLSFYEILGPLGAGAMGEVYRARDSKLEREVAIKVLPEHFAEDEERLKRFEREAKTLASLNHPNVAQIFGVDQGRGQRAQRPAARIGSQCASQCIAPLFVVESVESKRPPLLRRKGGQRDQCAGPRGKPIEGGRGDWPTP